MTTPFSQRPKPCGFGFGIDRPSSSARSGESNTILGRASKQITGTHITAAHQPGSYVHPTQIHSTEGSQGTVKYEVNPVYGDASRLQSSSSRGRLVETQCWDLPDRTCRPSSSGPRKRERSANDNEFNHSGPSQHPMGTLDEFLRVQVYQDHLLSREFTPYLTNQHAYESNQAFDAQVFKSKYGEQLLASCDLAGESTPFSPYAPTKPLALQSSQSASEQNHFPVDRYHCSSSDACKTHFPTTAWSPPLLSHAAASSSLAAEDSYIDNSYCYPSSIEQLQLPNLDNERYEAADATCPALYIDPPDTIIMSESPNEEEWPSNEQATSLESSIQNDAFATGERHSTQHSAITCSDCGVQFTGHYGKRNAKRHMQSVHKKMLCYCDADGCNRPFNRSDAVLVHKRRSHVDMDSSSPRTRVAVPAESW